MYCLVQWLDDPFSSLRIPRLKKIQEKKKVIREKAEKETKARLAAQSARGRGKHALTVCRSGTIHNYYWFTFHS